MRLFFYYLCTPEKTKQINYIGIMKKVKLFVMVAAAIFMGTTMISCLDSDNSNLYDGTFYGTVIETLGSVYIVSDVENIRFTPTNPSVLQSNGEYPERVFIFFKYTEGEVYQEGKTSYSIEILPDYSAELTVKQFNNSPDTLTSYPLSALSEGWGVANEYTTSRYLMIPFACYINSSATSYVFDMYTERAGNDTVYLTFNHSVGGIDNSYGGVSNSGVSCFRIPADLYYMDNLVPKNDSIVIQVQAKGLNDVTLKGKPFKIKATYY